LSFLSLIALHNSRNPFSRQITLKGNQREDPAFSNLAAWQLAGLGLEAHGFGMSV